MLHLRKETFVGIKVYAGEHRLGSTAAALKLKGIDGGPHKQWSMGLNAMLRAKPYQPFYRTDFVMRRTAWLSSVRDLCPMIHFRNEQNPRAQDASVQTALEKGEEGADDVKSLWSLWVGLHLCYNGSFNR